MIELPEGLVLAEQLDRELRDKRITDVRANTSPPSVRLVRRGSRRVSPPVYRP